MEGGYPAVPPPSSCRAEGSGTPLRASRKTDWNSGAERSSQGVRALEIAGRSMGSMRFLKARPACSEPRAGDPAQSAHRAGRQQMIHRPEKPQMAWHRGACHRGALQFARIDGPEVGVAALNDLLGHPVLKGRVPSQLLHQDPPSGPGGRCVFSAKKN